MSALLTNITTQGKEQILCIAVNFVFLILSCGKTLLYISFLSES